MKRVMMVFGIVAFMLVAAPVHAAKGYFRGTIVKTMVTDGVWGGCIAKMDVDFTGTLPSCPGGWVAFSCTGTHSAKDIAYRKFDAAQMSQALSRKVGVTLDDTKKHDGYCYGVLIEVLPAPAAP